MKEFRMLINGELVNSPLQLDVLNPATGALLTRCPRADETMLNAAVEAASAAFGSWSQEPVDERARRLHELSAQIKARADEFTQLLTREQGKPLEQAAGEIGAAAFTLDAFADMRLGPETLQDRATGKVIEHRVPLGVIAAITPWNFPILLLMNKLAPALLAGNTVVIKPAPTTPLTTLLLGELCATCFPAGVVNVIVDDNDLGTILTRHPHIAKIAFTGSTATGKKVMANAATNVKRITLELGGNDGAIVLDDVDPEKAAQALFNGAMLNAGQICVAIKRAYVPARHYDAICEHLGKLAQAAVVGDGLTPGTQIGPVQNLTQFEKLKGYLRDAAESGEIVAGGFALERAGYFIAPTIVRNIPDSSRLVQEEQFGPILPVLPYDSLDDAIARVNSSEYGLAATVWGKDLDLANQVAAKIDAGTVWVNQHLAMDPTVPFRGTKQSGFGVELGLEGLKEYTQARVISSVSMD
ncbi:MAG: aldehyde dehydrogenase family protein [Janthinobacterium lividum]